LDWRAAGELIAATPELREAAPRVTDAAAAARTEAAS
ncbi:TetR/AcrR family transcriptional regulator, partial [Clavibacter michiganensis subsp. insidiosus]